MPKLFKTLATLFIFTSFNTNAIVNTESSIQSFKKLGLNGEVNLELKGSGGNRDSSDISADAAIGWKTTHSKSILLLGREFGKSNTTTNTDSHFIYFKHLQTIQENIHSTFFAQSEKDRFKDIESRDIVGLGVRARVNTNNLVELSLMQEDIKSTVASEANRSSTRLNIMLHFSYQLDKKIGLKNTAYYQPKINDFSDKQAINQASIFIHINKHLKLNMYHKLTHFSEPIGNAKSTDTSYGTKFSYLF